MSTRSSRRALPILPIFLVFAAASTGTVLASDTCGLVLVKTLTDVAHSAQEHTAVHHKYTRDTLTRWQVWGNLYLAKHGHPYVPPKRPAHSSTDADAQQARFKLECDLPPVPVADLTTFDLLPPEELEETPQTIEILPIVATNDVPPQPVGSSIIGYPGGPVFFGPGTGGSPAPLVPNVPPAVTPEPSSWLLFATGLAAVSAFAKFRPTDQTN